MLGSIENRSKSKVPNKCAHFFLFEKALLQLLKIKLVLPPIQAQSFTVKSPKLEQEWLKLRLHPKEMDQCQCESIGANCNRWSRVGHSVCQAYAQIELSSMANVWGCLRRESSRESEHTRIITRRKVRQKCSCKAAHSIVFGCVCTCSRENSSY